MQALPDLTQPAVAAQTPVSPNLSSAHISSPETPGSTAATANSMSGSASGRALVNGQQQQQSQQDGNKKESAGTLGKQQQQHHNNASSHSLTQQHQQQTPIANQLATNASSGGNVAGASVGGGAAAATVQSQNLSTNPNAAVTAQNTAPMVQTLMHVIPQPLVS